MIGMSVVPPASKQAAQKHGYDFEQNGIWFSDVTLEKLIAQVESYRAGNGLPIDDAAREVANFNTAKTQKVISSKARETLRAKVIKWLETKLRLKPKYVTTEEANRRAAICAHCPHNIIHWKKGENCGQCLDNINRAAAIILMGKPQHNTLGACEKLAQYNKVGVWLDDPKSTQDLPDFCWRK